MIIAIDGPAASGKGTIARYLAQVYGLHHLDTGLLYRAVGKAMLDSGYPLDDAARAIEAAVALDPKKFDDNALKLQAITEAASVVAAIPQVRQALMSYQRQFAMKAARRRARRPRYRHRHRPRRRREAVRHRHARKCAPPAASSSCGRGAKRRTRRRSWPTCCAATSAIPGAPPPP